jgi:hypothetical protein
MSKAEQRMAQHHAGAGIAHNCSYAFTHPRAVAMHGAVITSWFICVERAVVQTAQGIVQQSDATVAQFVFTAMMISAVKAHHGGNGLSLPLHVLVLCSHIEPAS